MMFRWEYGVDLGTSRISIACPEKKLFCRQANLLAMDGRSGRVCAMGDEALAMLGRTPPWIEVYQPVEKGLVSRPELAALLLKSQFRAVRPNNPVASSRLCLCTPVSATGVERDTLVDVAMKAGIKHVMLMERPMAAALGAGLDIFAPQGKMVIEIGAGTTDIALFSLGGIVEAESIKIGGDDFDQAIRRFLKEKFSLLVGQRTAEAIKIRAAGCLREDFDETLRIKGKNLHTGLPEVHEADTLELYRAVEAVVRRIVRSANQVMERAAPELAGDLHTQGIVLTGGGARLRGLPDYLAGALRVPVRLAEHASGCAAWGAARGAALEKRLENGVLVF